MKIGYLLSPGTMVSGRSNGIRKQAMIWQAELQRRGHEVVWLDASGSFDWGSFSLVHVFQGGEWLRSVVPALRRRVQRMVFSPIIDSNQPPWLYRLAAGLEIKPLRLRTENAITRETALLVDQVLVRSRHEAALVEKGLGVGRAAIRMVKIGFETATVALENAQAREPVCLHVSSFTQPRKNVARLIEACALAGVELWIAGSPGNQQDFAAMRGKAAGRAVKFLGFQSDEQLARLMTRARVFALPSLCEGVGLAALEAAALGCEIVVTKRGGPPDYFGPRAHYVDPYDVNSITAALLAAGHSQGQPGLGAEVRLGFSARASVDALEKCYQELLC